MGRDRGEPPGEVHTLMVDNDDEMITLFHIQGAMIYIDDEGRYSHYEDLLTKIEMCSAHYSATGLGADYIDRYIR